MLYQGCIDRLRAQAIEPQAHPVTMGIKSGMLHVNTYGGSDVTIPMGGMKQSGNGIDKSLHALDKYVDLKSVWMKI